MRWSANYVVGAVLVAGLGVLGVSVYQLQTIFLAESSRNAQLLSERKQSIESYAAKLIEDALREQMLEGIATAEELARQPLRDSDGYFWQENGVQRLPLPASAAAPESSAARAYYQEIANTLASRTEATNINTTHETLRRLQTAINGDDQAAIESNVRKLLAYDAAHVLRPAEELVDRLLLLEVFSAYPQASPVLIRRLLRDGLSDERDGVLAGLQDLLLLARSSMSEADFEFFRDRTVALSRAHNVKFDDLLARIDGQADIPELGAFTARFVEENKQPGDGRATQALLHGKWLMQRAGDQLYGVRLDMSSLLERVQGNMLQLGLLSSGDELLMHIPPVDVTGINDISFEWRSDTWKQALADLQRFDTIKEVMLLTTLTILLAMAFLLWWIYQKQARWVNVKSEFVATVSHEMRTPLSGIRLMAERLGARLAGDDRARDYPQRIIADIDALSFLADNILSFERLNSGRWVTHKSPVSLQDLTGDLSSELRLYTKRDFVVEAAGDPHVQVDADPVLMKLLFTNLAKNSCNYNDKDLATIQIDWLEEKGKVVVNFRDNGSGISADEVEDCFAPFYRGRDQRHSRGSGLGLALCKKIVNLHQGSIEVVNSSPKGTHIQFSLKAYNHE